MTHNGHVTVKIETFDDKGNRTNIECFSLRTHSFLYGTVELDTNLSQAIERTRKEIINPTPKTDMA